MSKAVLDFLQARFGDAILEDAQPGAATTRSSCAPIAGRWRVTALHAEDPSMAFDMLVDLCGVDYPDRSPRFEVVLHLYSIKQAAPRPLEVARGRRRGRRGRDRLGVRRVDRRRLVRKARDVGHARHQVPRPPRPAKPHPHVPASSRGIRSCKDYPARLTQPLIPYRTEEEAGLPLGKLAPFREDEGMSFGRQQWTKNDVEPS